MSDIAREEVLPIDRLIARRLAVLNLSSVMLVERCGYSNISKGLRRLASLRAGDFTQASHLVAALSRALEVAAEEVRDSIEQTSAELSARRERAWRERFLPHAIILTERERPSQITIAIVCGFINFRRIDFPDGMPTLGYVGFTRSEIGARLVRWRGEAPTFGKPTGFIINYSPDSAVAFDLEGTALQQYERAYELGDVSFELSGRAVPLRFGTD
jgi:hypothetical protein